jgi:DNA-binding Xre family transcriptional regulator
MPSLVQEIVGDHLDEITDKDLAVMIDDCDFQRRMELYGDECDKADWLKWERRLLDEKKKRAESEEWSNTEFYQAIDKLCAEKGITHKRLAEIAGIHEVTLSRYLTGQRKISLSAFIGICEAFGVKAEDLYKAYLFSNMEHETHKESEE